MPIQKFKDIQLYYDEYGSGERYLLSAMQGHTKIDDYAIDLANHGFHVFLITIRGYGESTHVFEDYGDRWYDIWAQDVCDFASSKNIEKFFYSGISHGAGIGWHLCINHPERIRGFFSIVGGPHSKDGQDTGEARLRTVQAAESPETWKAYVEETFGKGRSGLMGIEGQEQTEVMLAKKEEFYQRMLNMSPEEARINPRKPFSRVSTEQELIDLLSQIKLHVLLLGGMRDPISLPENVLRSGKAITNSKTVLYEQAGHGLASERKVEILDDILLFCRQRKLV